jgi:hypothetical protein
VKFELARAAEDPQRWRVEAHSLRSASRLLLAHWLETPGSAGGVAFPAMMLAGYAIEDFAKARILELGETWDRTRGHDLPWLVAKAGIPIDWAEDELLRRLKQIVTWAGRYPTPLNLSDATPWPKQASDADFKRIDQIYERLRVPVERLEEDVEDFDGDFDDIGD